MKKYFVPCKLALKLKDLGFDKQCFAGWDENKQFRYHPDSDIIVDAPIWEQAFEFMANKFGINGHVQSSGYFGEYQSWEYKIGFSGTASNNKVHTDIFKCRKSLLKSMIKRIKE